VDIRSLDRHAHLARVEERAVEHLVFLGVYVVMAYISMAYIVMAYIVMAYIVMALYSYGLYNLWPIQVMNY
jgi:hypothetical protein